MSVECWSTSGVAGQFLVGCGAGAAMIPAQNLPMLWFPAAKRGFASGLPTAGVGVGVVLVGIGFPWLLGLEVSGLTGWRLAWLGIGGMLLTTALFAGLWLRESPQAKVRSEDAREVIRTWRIWHLCLVYLLFGLSYLSYVAFFGIVLSNQRHWLPGASGRAWALGGILSISSGLLWGALSDRIGRRQAIGLVFSVQALSYLILASCRLQRVDPYVYFVDVLQRIDTHPAFEVHLLTPRLWKQHFAAAPLRSDLDRYPYR